MTRLLFRPALAIFLSLLALVVISTPALAVPGIVGFYWPGWPVPCPYCVYRYVTTYVDIPVDHYYPVTKRFPRYINVPRYVDRERIIYKDVYVAKKPGNCPASPVCRACLACPTLSGSSGMTATSPESICQCNCP